MASTTAKTVTISEDALTEVRNGALWVTFNRPQAMNSLTEGIIETLEWALDQIDENPDLRALVVTGTGRAFCAGADLSIGGGSDGDEGEGTGQYRAMLERALKLFSRLDNAKRPTIAALNGITLAGGLEIALACDIIVAAASAKIGDGHVKFGQLPAGGGTVRLPRRVGASFAKYLMFTGAVLTAEEALAASLVEKVAPDEQLQDTVDEIVAAVGAASPIGVSLMKELVHAGLSLGPEQALDNELSVAVEYSKSEDRKEGLAAFRERRAPVFIGR